MPAQVWAQADRGAYLYADNLSKRLRMVNQPLTKFRNLCDAADGSEMGLHQGDKFRWNIVGNVATQGYRLAELEPIPETNVTISQGELTIYEYGNSVPYTGLLENLAEMEISSIIDVALGRDSAKCFDIEAYLQFDATPLTVQAATGTSTTSVTFETTGVPTITNNVEMGLDHVKAIVDGMKERNIPPMKGTDEYGCIARPGALRPFKNDLEAIGQYTETGFAQIMTGEIGRAEGTRFVEQTHIPSGGAHDSVTFDPFTGTGDPWNNGKSDWAFFFGGDTVMEASVIPEEVRAKIPQDYGRSRGISWYALQGMRLVHQAAATARVAKWDSAA